MFDHRLSAPFRIITYLREPSKFWTWERGIKDWTEQYNPTTLMLFDAVEASSRDVYSCRKYGGRQLRIFSISS